MKKALSFLCALGGMFNLSGCSPVSLLNVTVSEQGYSVHKNIAYATAPRQRLDIYVPDRLAKPAPVIVFFYGGSWNSGKKEDFLFVGQALASKGFIAVIADYRLYPDVYFPAFMDDGAAAFRFVHDHIGEYGGDPKRLFLSGHSAGAYIAVMLTFNDSYLRKDGAEKSWIRGTIGISGPYDFLPMTDPEVIAVFSKTDAASTQPIHFIEGRQPPMLLVTGDADTTVLPRNAYNVEKKLRALDSPVEVHTYPGVAHIGIILSLTRLFRYKAPLLDDIARFVDQEK